MSPGDTLDGDKGRNKDDWCPPGCVDRFTQCVYSV